MSADRPINADVPAPDEAGPPTREEKQPEPPAAAEKPSQPEQKPSEPKRRRQPIPGALKAIAALALLAVVFIVVAVIGGSGGGKDATESAAPAPAPAAGGEDPQPSGGDAEELGYPSFATGNTTRVGGSDPATNAAGVALAVFPATVPEQRPIAVTLVDEADPAGAIAAAVLMAAPLRAPLLVSAAGGLPEPTAEALEALDPEGGKESGGATAFALGDVATPEGGKVTTVKAGTAAATAAAIAALRDRLFGAPPAHVVLAPADDLALAAPAAAWAARSGDPVLFTEGGKLPQATLAALRRHPDVPVYVLGPSSAISSQTLRAVGKVAKEVHRVSGEDPVANAVAFARYGDGGFGWNVNDPGHGFVVARADAPLDAAVAAPLSASGTWGPLLLSDSATALPDQLREYFLDVKPGYTTNPTRAFYNHVWVIGDQDAIDVAQQAEINELAELAKIGGEQ